MDHDSPINFSFLYRETDRNFSRRMLNSRSRLRRSHQAETMSCRFQKLLLLVTKMVTKRLAEMQKLEKTTPADSDKLSVFRRTIRGRVNYESAALPLSYLGVCNDNSIR